MTRIIALVALSIALLAVEIPPIERSFRILVIGEDGKPVDGVPVYWSSEVENGLNAFGGRNGKNVARKVLLSANAGVVEIPKHTFSTISLAINENELKSSSLWMVDSKTNSQFLAWDVYRKDNPEKYALGPPTPGFDAVFKVLSKNGISNLMRYNASHKQVPCDGTPMPLRVLGGPSAQVKNPDDADVVITINRPDQEVFSRDSGKLYVAKPLRVPWVLESRTLRFAHFAADTDLSADYGRHSWTSRLEIQPTHPDHEESQGHQALRLWAMIPGDPAVVVPMKCRIGLSYDSRNLGKAVYSVNFEVILPLAPCTRYHPDLLSIEHYLDLAPEISGDAINVRLDPIRAAALIHPFPDDLMTTPVLRYDTNPTIPWSRRTLPVLLP